MHLYPPASVQCSKNHDIQTYKLCFDDTFLKYAKYLSVLLTFDINHNSQEDKQPWLSPISHFVKWQTGGKWRRIMKYCICDCLLFFSVTNLFWLLLWVAHLVVIQVTLLWFLCVTVPPTFNEKVITVWAGEQNIWASRQGGGGDSFGDLKEMPVAQNADMCHWWRCVQGTQDRATELGDKFGI